MTKFLHFVFEDITALETTLRCILLQKVEVLRSPSPPAFKFSKSYGAQRVWVQ